MIPELDSRTERCLLDMGGDQYFARNQRLMESKKRQARADLVAARQEGDEIGVLIAKANLAYLIEADENNHGAPWTGERTAAACEELRTYTSRHGAAGDVA